MKHRVVPFVAIALVGLMAACGGTAAPASSSAPAAASAAASIAARPSTAASAGGGASGSAAAKPGGPPQFVEGTVKSIDTSSIALTNGQSFTLGANTPFIDLVDVKPTDLKVGQSLAITAKLQQDGTLLASNIRIAAEPGASGLNASQFPMGGGNLMTNAPVKSVTPNSLVVTLPGGDVTVKMAPDAVIQRQQPGSRSDAKAGSDVLIISGNGTSALVVGVTMPAA